MARLLLVRCVALVSLAVVGSSEVSDSLERQLRGAGVGDIRQEDVVAQSGERSEPQLEGSAVGEVLSEAAEVAAQALPATREHKVALALGGGGFRAFAVDVALAAGVAAAKSKSERSRFSSLSASKLFGRFEAISTVSGSTWFLSQLGFSGGFSDLLDRMAAAPQAAGSTFRSGWMDAWIALGRNDGDRMSAQAFLETLHESGLSFLETDFREISYFWKRGLSWNDFVATLLRKTGDVGSDVLLGSPLSSPLLRGKTWLVGHSVVIGAEKQKAQLSSKLIQTVKYSLERATFEEDLPVFLPAKYSVVLGGGEDSPAPVPYLGVDVSRGLEYEGNVFFGLWGTHATSPPLGELSRSLSAHSSALPVVGVASASSAFAGGICLNPLLSTAAGVLDSEFTPFAALSGGSSAFQVGMSVTRDLASKGVSSSRVDAAARAGIVGLADGAYTDNSGVGSALAAGASEVVVVLNDLEALYSLFRNGLGTQRQVGVPRLHLPVFAETLAQPMFKDLTEFHLPADKLLSKLSTFSIDATTDRAELFGIESGRAVQLHVVYVKTTLSIGGLDDYNSYTRLVQEIVDCLISTENEKAVQDSLIHRLF